MENDFFAGTTNSLTSPAQSCFAITPADDQDLAQATKAIYIGQAGDVRLLALQDAEAVTFLNVAAGSVLDVRARRILATGTSASDMIGLV